MKKTIFDKDGIEEIRKYLESGHTKRETCNRFTIKLNTLNKVIRKNNIKQQIPEKPHINEVSKEQEKLICTLFRVTYMSLLDIQHEVGVEQSAVMSVLKENFSQYEIDRRVNTYKGTDVVDGKGYVIIPKPEWYVGRKNSKYVYLHSVVMCESLGITEIPKGFCVHHIDGNKTNNDISNLCLLTVEAHSKLHQIQRKMCKGPETNQTNDVGKPKR